MSISNWGLLIFGTGIGALVAGLVSDQHRRAATGLVWASLLIFMVIDWALLVLLPISGLSYGPVASSLFLITAARLIALLITALSLLIGKQWHAISRTFQNIPIQKTAWFKLFLIFNLVGTVGIVYGMYFEPFNLRVSEIQVAGFSQDPIDQFSILHLSDIHVERFGLREQTLLEMVDNLQPDLIVLTGDYPNIDYKEDPTTLRDTRAMLAKLSAPYGVYAVPGTIAVDTPKAIETIFSNLDITLLRDEIHQLQISDEQMFILGVSAIDHERDSRKLSELVERVPDNAYKLLLYHKPDLIETADELGVDLYLAGHTHGGQIRLPFYGAIVTSSRYHKQYESGLYKLNPTTLYVSRGIGMEGLSLPRVRFLCPPELVLVHIGG